MDAFSVGAFAIISLIGIATPGPTTLLALSNGTRVGASRAVPGMLGAVVSDFVLIGAVSIGLGALLAASEFWFAVVKWLGVAYLTFLGVMLLRSRAGLKALSHEDRGVSARALFLKSFLVAVTNPKGILFFTAFLPQFIASDAPLLPQYMTLAVVFAAIDFAVMFGYALLGSRAVRFLQSSGAIWLDRLCGGIFLGLAGSLAVYRRTA